MPDTTLAELHGLADCLRLGLHRVAVETTRRFPIGLYTTYDGRQVLHDAGYNPIWERVPRSRRPYLVRVADRNEWVEDVKHQEFIFEKHGVPPQQQYEAMKRLRAILVEWGLIPRAKEKPRSHDTRTGFRNVNSKMREPHR